MSRNSRAKQKKRRDEAKARRRTANYLRTGPKGMSRRAKKAARNQLRPGPSTGPKPPTPPGKTGRRRQRRQMNIGRCPNRPTLLPRYKQQALKSRRARAATAQARCSESTSDTFTRS